MSISKSELREKIRALNIAANRWVVDDGLENRVDSTMALFDQAIAEARIDENNACQNIIKSKWGTNDQLWDMQDRIKQLRDQTNKPSEDIEL